MPHGDILDQMKSIHEFRRTIARAGTLEWIGLRPARRAEMVAVTEAEAQALVGLIGDHGKQAPARIKALMTEEEEPITTGYTPPVIGGQGRRQVTLIQAEHLPVIAALSGLNLSSLNLSSLGTLGETGVPPELLRRNLVVSGISLLALKDQRFRVGEVILEGTGECHPCSRMEENLGLGGYNAVRGHGGITARVITGGRIKLGNIVEALS